MRALFQALRALVIVVLALLVTGCGLFSTVPKITLTNKEYVVIVADAQMTKDCPQAEPPEVDAYVGMTPKQKEGVLYALSQEQMDIIQKCNLQWQSLREWQAKQVKIYTEKNNQKK